MERTNPGVDGTASRPASAEQNKSRLPGCSTPLAGYSAPTGHHHNSLRAEKENKQNIEMKISNKKSRATGNVLDPVNRK